MITVKKVVGGFVGVHYELSDIIGWDTTVWTPAMILSKVFVIKGNGRSVFDEDFYYHEGSYAYPNDKPRTPKNLHGKYKTMIPGIYCYKLEDALRVWPAAHEFAESIATLSKFYKVS